MRNLQIGLGPSPLLQQPLTPPRCPPRFSIVFKAVLSPPPVTSSLLPHRQLLSPSIFNAHYLEMNGHLQMLHGHCCYITAVTWDWKSNMSKCCRMRITQGRVSGFQQPCCRFGLYCVIFFMWLECTFLDWSCVSKILIFLSSLRASVVTDTYFLSSLKCVREWPHLSLCLSPRLLETDDTEEPKGKTNSPLSLQSDPLLFHRLLYPWTHSSPLYYSVLKEYWAHCWCQITYFVYRCWLFNTLPLRRSERKQIYRCLWLCFVCCII